jgi:hypothetical protein
MADHVNCYCNKCPKVKQCAHNFQDDFGEVLLSLFDKGGTYC